MQTAQEERGRRERKCELLEFGLTHLRRRLDALSRRTVGAQGSLKRRNIQATLRDQLRDQLQKQLRGNEGWNQVRGLVEDLVAAWFVAHPPASRIPTSVKLLAAGATGLIGGATVAAALSPAIRAGVAQLKAPLLSLTDQLIKHLSTPSPSPPHPPNQTTITPPSFRAGIGYGAGWPRSSPPRSWYSRPGSYKSPKATREASWPPPARREMPLRRAVMQSPGPPEVEPTIMKTPGITRPANG